MAKFAYTTPLKLIVSVVSSQIWGGGGRANFIKNH